MDRKRRILIIEDEKDISRIIRDYLNMNGYEATTAGTGTEGLNAVDTLVPDFIVLDIMLPDMDGIEICRKIRDKSNVPVLILSARGSDTDKVLGLGFGADDYMTKPFSVSELVARINAHLRRIDNLSMPSNNGKSNDNSVSNDTSKSSNNSLICFDGIQIDEKAYSLKVDGKDVELPAREFELLCFLAKHKNQVFSRDQLMDLLWGYADTNTITVYIRRIREKIEPDPANPKYIKTVWGIGYKFNIE